MVRGKVQLKRIQNPINRQVTFSKRKAGLLKKASELSVLCEAEVALIIFSPTGKQHEFASSSMNRIVEKYQTYSSSTGQYTQLSDNVEALRLEVDNLKTKMTHLERINNHMIGKDLDSMHFRDLQHLEKRLNLGARKIHSRKVKTLLSHIGSFKTKLRSLKEENANLRKKLSDYNSEIIEGVDGELERDALPLQNLSLS